MVRCTLLLSLLLFPVSAEAYFDPGSGLFLFQSLSALLLGILASAGGVAWLLYRRAYRRCLRFAVAWSKNATAVVATVAFLFAFGGMVAAYGTGESKAELMQKLHYGPVRNTPVVAKHDPELAYRGYNYLWGNLFDMEGNVVHSWNRPGFRGALGVIDGNGDLYAQSQMIDPPWGRYRLDGTPVWEKDYPIHHEIVLEEDRLHVFTKEAHRYRGRDVAFDVIVTLDKDGNELSRWSAWENLETLQEYHPLFPEDVPLIPIEKHPIRVWDGAEYEYYHLNSMQIVPPNDREGEHPLFTPGNWLLSFRSGSMLMVLDGDTKEVLWTALGRDLSEGMEGQHGPLMLPDGSILIFDNGRYRKYSRVIIFDPLTLDIVWQYTNSRFYTETGGYAQPLPNGNILVAEDNQGRAFEVTRAKEVVWIYFGKKQGNRGRRQAIYRMIRYPPAYVESFLEAV